MNQSMRKKKVWNEKFKISKIEFLKNKSQQMIKINGKKVKISLSIKKRNIDKNNES